MKILKASNLFDTNQLNLLQDSIQQYEKKTNGELRLHLENRCESELLERATEVFYLLQMEGTENRNGILIYISILDKKVAIIGDEGIYKVTQSDFWEKEIELVLGFFKKQEYVEGLVKVIYQMGEKSRIHFPQNENYSNELSDEISFYDN